MTGCKKYYKIPILTKLFNVKFYLYWRDDKFYNLGFSKDKMTIGEAFCRLEEKRLWRESIDNL